MASSLSIANVVAGYGAVRVLEDVSLDVRDAETAVLLGTNGNGKSTLMKCIMGMLRPSSGTIIAEIDGTHADRCLEIRPRAYSRILGLSEAGQCQGAEVPFFPRLLRKFDVENHADANLPRLGDLRLIAVPHPLAKQVSRGDTDRAAQPFRSPRHSF